MSDSELDPSHIMEVGVGFWPAKTLLSAVELDLFSLLGGASMSGEEVGARLGLHPRAIDDFLDALVALGFLDRDGQGTDGRYRNSAEAAAFLDKESPSYVGGFLEMCNDRSYGFWGELTEALKTAQPQTEVKLQGPHELLEPSGVAVELLEDRLAGEARAHRSPTFTSSPSGSTSLATRPSATWAAPRANSVRPLLAATPTCAAPPTTCRWWRPSPRSRSPRPGSTH
jgi:hypothetical protein